MLNTTPRASVQVYERDKVSNGPSKPLTCIGRISDIYWDDEDNRILRGFTLVDSDLAFGKGLSILDYCRQPYLSNEQLTDIPLADNQEYAINKFVKVTFEVFDTYEEAAK